MIRLRTAVLSLFLALVLIAGRALSVEMRVGNAS